MAGLDFPLSTLHPFPHGSRRMTRGRIGTLSLNSCGSFIRYSPPALTGAFPDTFYCFRDAMRQLVASVIGWYNEQRPHSTLKGATPNEVYFVRFPANRKPRIEPRPRWPRGSPCALPHALVAGKPGSRFNIEVEHVDGLAQLPIIRLRRAA